MTTARLGLPEAGRQVADSGNQEARRALEPMLAQSHPRGGTSNSVALALRSEKAASPRMRCHTGSRPGHSGARLWRCAAGAYSRSLRHLCIESRLGAPGRTSSFESDICKADQRAIRLATRWSGTACLPQTRDASGGLARFVNGLHHDASLFRKEEMDWLREWLCLQALTCCIGMAYQQDGSGGQTFMPRTDNALSAREGARAQSVGFAGNAKYPVVLCLT